MKLKNICLYAILTTVAICSCGPSAREKAEQEKAEQARIDSLVNAKVNAAKAEMEDKAQREEEERMRKEQEAKAALEAVRPSGSSLREREMRFYYDQGYDFGSHPSFSKMDDAWMRKAFLYVVSQHDMSHAGNQTLLNSFMAGVAQGRAELKDLQE